VRLITAKDPLEQVLSSTMYFSLLVVQVPVVAVAAVRVVAAAKTSSTASSEQR